MLTKSDKTKILEDVYEESIIDRIDFRDIRKLLDLMSYDNAKIALIGNKVLSRRDIWLPDSISK